MGCEVRYDLIGSDTHANSPTYRLACYFPSHHVGIPRYESCEELEDGDLKVRGCICVDAVIRFDYNEAAVCICRGGEGGGAQTAGVRGQSCGEAGGVKVGGFRRSFMDYAEVAQIVEHLALGGGEVGFAVGNAELERAEGEEE